MTRDMSSFGEKLRVLRESHEIALDEIAESTKISKRYLQALERNEFEELPGGVFAKGYIRTYAEYLGVNPEPLLEAYVSELQSRGEGDPAEAEKAAADKQQDIWDARKDLADEQEAMAKAIAGSDAVPLSPEERASMEERISVSGGSYSGWMIPSTTGTINPEVPIVLKPGFQPCLKGFLITLDFFKLFLDIISYVFPAFLFVWHGLVLCYESLNFDRPIAIS